MQRLPSTIVLAKIESRMLSAVVCWARALGSVALTISATLIPITAKVLARTVATEVALIVSSIRCFAHMAGRVSICIPVQ